ncbi:MAG: ROK family protein [Deltaproteobacteria bacterium]
MAQDDWALGVDLGGTKVEVAAVNTSGTIRRLLRKPADVQGGPDSIVAQIAQMARELKEQDSSAPLGVGVGVAGQIAADTGVVQFSPNLNWHGVPFQEKLDKALKLPVVILNDVRAATWGEWLHGAGQGVDDLICLFIGTGIGGGVVSAGKVLSGASNAAGELGHITVDLHGPICTCGNRGCLEALAGGWAIARRAMVAINDSPLAGEALLKAAGLSKPIRAKEVNAKLVTDAAQAGDPLARLLVEEIIQALIAGAVGLVNAFNPSRLILGGGVTAGLPQLVERLDQGIRRYALKAAGEAVEVLPAKLGNNAGVVGAATLALQSFEA